MYSVPQGSILGPLLFILYINDLTNVVPNYHVSPFADNSTVIIKCKYKISYELEINEAEEVTKEESILKKLKLRITVIDIVIITSIKYIIDSRNSFKNCIWIFLRKNVISI